MEAKGRRSEQPVKPQRRVIAVGKRQDGRWQVRTSLWRYLAATALSSSARRSGRRSSRAVERGGARLDEVEDARLQADAVEAVDLLDAGRARDVHLGHEPPMTSRPTK